MPLTKLSRTSSEALTDEAGEALTHIIRCLVRGTVRVIVIVVIVIVIVRVVIVRGTVRVIVIVRGIVIVRVVILSGVSDHLPCLSHTRQPLTHSDDSLRRTLTSESEASA